MSPFESDSKIKTCAYESTRQKKYSNWSEIIWTAYETRLTPTAYCGNETEEHERNPETRQTETMSTENGNILKSLNLDFIAAQELRVATQLSNAVASNQEKIVEDRTSWPEVTKVASITKLYPMAMATHDVNF